MRYAAPCQIRCKLTTTNITNTTRIVSQKLQMESNAFVSSHLPSQALVVLSEAASGLHEALRGQRPFPARVSKHSQSAASMPNQPTAADLSRSLNVRRRRRRCHGDIFMTNHKLNGDANALVVAVLQ